MISDNISISVPMSFTSTEHVACTCVLSYVPLDSRRRVFPPTASDDPCLSAIVSRRERDVDSRIEPRVPVSCKQHAYSQPAVCQSALHRRFSR